LRIGTIPTPVDANGDGIPESFVYAVRDIDVISIEEATVTFEPFEWLSVKGGVMRLPYTIDNGDIGTAGLFNHRSPTNEVFLNGPDVGIMALGKFANRFRIQTGVVNGKSLGLGPDPAVIEVRGPTMVFRADLEPWGIFGFGEGDPNFGPFRLGFGFGTLWRPADYYDAGTGYLAATVNDVRLSGSLRLAYRYFDMRVEYVRAQVIDTLSSRPNVHDGGYANLSYYWMARGFALQPVVRLGFTTLNTLVEPRTAGWTELGLQLYPRSGQPRPDALKLWAYYQGERRFTESESAHGAKFGVDLAF
jgi:hypothetical protein